MSRDTRSPILSRLSPSGRFWIICAAAWWNLRPSCCSCSAGCALPGSARVLDAGNRRHSVRAGAGASFCFDLVRAAVWRQNQKLLVTQCDALFERQHCNCLSQPDIPGAPDAAVAGCSGANAGPAHGHAATALAMGNGGRSGDWQITSALRWIFIWIGYPPLLRVRSFGVVLRAPRSFRGACRFLLLGLSAS